MEEVIEPVELNVSREGVRIPALMWIPESTPRGLIVIGHGGGGHKGSPTVSGFAKSFLAKGYASLCIDGPVHGDRDPSGEKDPLKVRSNFSVAWRNGVGQREMPLDTVEALSAAIRRLDAPHLPIVYLGLSMGTAYGLGFVARDSRVRGAVLGLWGTTFNNSQHLGRLAADVQCPVAFFMQWDDEIFDREGVLELYAKIASDDKRLFAFPGGHKDLVGERFQLAAHFLYRCMETTK